jgi:hypothetical protein
LAVVHTNFGSPKEMRVLNAAGIKIFQGRSRVQ